MPTIIDRYLFREVIKVMLAFAVTLLLVIISQQFIKYLGKVAEGGISQAVIFKLLGIQVIRYLPVILPPAFFFAALFTFGNMYRSAEMAALASGGIGPIRLLRSLLFSAIPMAILVGYLSFEAGPWTERLIFMLEESREDTAELIGLSAGQFNEYSKGDLVVYLESVTEDGARMENIFVQSRQHGKTGIITARYAQRTIDKETGDIFAVLLDGKRYEGTIGEADFSILEFEKYGLWIAERKEEVKVIRRKAKPTGELIKELAVKDLRVKAQAEFQRRLSFPLLVAVFALLAVPLSYSLPRQGVYGRLFLAGLVYFSYLNLLSAGATWIKHEVTPAWLGLWWVHGIMLGLALMLLFRDSRWGRRLFGRLRRRRAA